MSGRTDIFQQTGCISLDKCHGYRSLFDLAALRLLVIGKGRDRVEVNEGAFGLSLRSIGYLARLLADDGLITLNALESDRIAFTLTEAGRSLVSDI